jgi:hypothetical protein
MQYDIDPSAYQGNLDSLKRCRRAAALQAAAPDLLAALIGLLICVGPREDAEPLDAYEDRMRLLKGQIARAKAAVAKATKEI